MALRPWRNGLWVLLGMGLGGCAGPRPRTYAQQGMDSVSNTCRTQPALCTGPESVMPVPRAAQVATLMAGAKLALDAEAKRAVESVLKKCAEDARSEVMLRYHDGKDPTASPLWVTRRSSCSGNPASCTN